MVLTDDCIGDGVSDTINHITFDLTVIINSSTNYLTQALLQFRNMPNKVAIVTGGTRGIGRGIAEHLALAGYDLILGYNSNSSAADTTRSALQSSHGVKVVTVGGDVAEQDTIDNMFLCLETEFPEQELGALVHNAGLHVGKTTAPAGDKATQAAAADKSILGDGSFDNFDQYDYYQNVYPKCFVRLVEGAAKHMGQGGHIVATSSPGCNSNQTPKTEYMLPGQAKAGLEYLVRHYAVLLAPKHITVNVIIPGFTRTEAWLPLTAPIGGIDGEAMKSRLSKRCPMNKWGTADDMGGVVAFLCSPAASYITGVAIPVDGGLHLM